MVSKKQKLARQRFKGANPEMFPKPELSQPKDPSKKKSKKKGSFKRRKDDSANPRRPRKSAFKKHPLRVPGMRPGDCCYICKDQDHIAKDCPKKALWEKNKICLLCRQRGHSLKNCTNKDDDSMDKKLCYNCGEPGHSLFKCPQPLQDGGTKFASCFICKERGHLSKNCPKNTNGIYPKGGSCKICGGVTHLAKDCPNKSSNGSTTTSTFGKYLPERPRGQVTKFVSGDDLEDDFTILEKQAANEAKTDDKTSATVEVKSKKKGPKVVNFVG